MKRRKALKRAPTPRRSSFCACCTLVLCLFLLGACRDGTAPPSSSQRSLTKAAEKKVTEPGPAVKVAEQKPAEKVDGKRGEETYNYNPAGKADPFKPFIQLSPVRELARRGPLTPLQKYEMSQLKLVAIMSTPDGNIALVEDSAGKGYFVKPGTWIGKNDGKVTRVLKDRVIVEEIYQDILGQTKANEISIILHRTEEGGES